MGFSFKENSLCSKCNFFNKVEFNDGEVIEQCRFFKKILNSHAKTCTGYETKFSILNPMLDNWSIEEFARQIEPMIIDKIQKQVGFVQEEQIEIRKPTRKDKLNY